MIGPGHRTADPLRVAVLGNGAIGRPVARALRDGAVPGAALCAVVDSTGARDSTGAPIAATDLPDRADLVVEAASQRGLADLGPSLIAGGVHLLVLSVGALADASLHRALNRGPGRLYLSTGAIGGLDLLRAVAASGTLQRVVIETTKLPETLVQDWMDEPCRQQLRAASCRLEVLRGTPQRIATAFPRSANVAMAVATAAGPDSVVEAAVYADPGATATTHEICVESSTGSYRFHIASRPSSQNPATSDVVPFAVLRALRDLAGRREMHV